MLRLGQGHLLGLTALLTILVEEFLLVFLLHGVKRQN